MPGSDRSSKEKKSSPSKQQTPPTATEKKPTAFRTNLTTPLHHRAKEAHNLFSEQKLDPTLIPVIEIPSLDGLSILVPDPPPLTEEEIQEAFQKLYFDALDRQLIAPGQPVQMGDELIVDLIGYMGGHIIPMSAKEGLHLLLQPDVFMPGFAEALAGKNVGEAHILHITLSDDFSVPEARGKTAVFAVEIRNAAKLLAPQNPDSPEFLARMGLGEKIDEIMKGIAVLLLDQRTRELAKTTNQMLIDAVLERAPFSLPDPMIDAEVRHAWQQNEGRFLAEKGVEQTDLEESLAGWLQDADTRKEAEHRLQSGLVLYAVAQKYNLIGDRADLKGFIGDVAESLGFKMSPQDKDLSRPFKERESLVDQWVYAKALAFLSKTITIQYQAPPA